jgi:predicted DNA-binding transcriptional regulator
MKEDGLYLDELFLLSLIFRLNQEKCGPVSQLEVNRGFNILSYRFRSMVQNLITRGLVNNDIIGPRRIGNKYRLILSPLGEQLLIKYDKELIRLCNEV